MYVTYYIKMKAHIDCTLNVININDLIMYIGGILYNVFILCNIIDAMFSSLFLVLLNVVSE